MIESWDDVLTVKQFEDCIIATVRELRTFLQACKDREVDTRIVLDYKDGCRLCFYPLSVACCFRIDHACLVVEDNFSRCGGGSLREVKDCGNDLNLAVRTFWLEPLRVFELRLKVIAKFSNDVK